MKKSKIKIIINVIIIIIVLFLTFYYLFKSNILRNESITSIKFYHVIVVFILFIISVIFFSLSEYFVYRTISSKMNPFDLFINSSFGHLGSSITPFRSGHFPLMIYFQGSKKMKIEESLTGITKAQVIYSFTTMVLYIIITIILLICDYSIVVMEMEVKLWYVILVGTSFHVLVFFMILVLSFNLKVQKGFIKLFTKILAKVKKNFDKEKYEKELEEKFIRYKNSIKDVFSNFKKYILVVIFYILHIMLLSLLEYGAYLVYSLMPFSIKDLVVFYILNLAMVYIANVIPLPGGFGTTEMMFVLVFSSVIEKDMIGSVLLIYRMGTYYIPIIFEVILFLIISSIINKRLIKIEKEDKQ